MKQNPIGIFDSGIGGLTVLREITRLLPGEEIIYLGDTARVPYGTKSKETVLRYSREVASYLRKYDVKMIVAACNTASAYAVEELKAELDIPVTGVIEPGAKAACASTRTSKVGVIGTAGTVKSGAYAAAIKSIDPSIETFTKACPLFVPLVEEGWADDDITAAIAERYLKELIDAGIDSLVLGCTHYPLLKKTIAKVAGPSITLIDSAASTASEVQRLLIENDMLRSTPAPAEEAHRFFVTDSPETFTAVGSRFYGAGLENAGLAQLTEQ